MNARSVIHVDMDAFFVSVELLRHPELRGRPVVVGGSGPRGVVAAASYEARAHGIYSAMAGARARRLCPHAVFLPGDHDHYRTASERVMAIFRSYTPLVEPISLDEAFLDVSGAQKLFGTPLEIGRALRKDILETEGLAASVGISAVKFIAKLASEAAKPKASPQGPLPGAGVFEVQGGSEIEFLHPLPIRALWGVGPATFERLSRLGVSTVGDLAALPVDALVASLGKAAGLHLHELANAQDPRRVQPDQRAKSVSHEQTYPTDIADPEALATELTRLGDAVGARLRDMGEHARTITVKIRFGDFSTITRSETLAAATDSGRRISRVARTLLDTVDTRQGVRLLGVGVSHFDDEAPTQMSLDDLLAPADQDRWDQAEDAISAVRARFGRASLGPARLAGPAGLKVVQSGEQQWGPNAPERKTDTPGAL